MLLFEWFRWKRSKLSWKTLKYIQRMAVKDRKNYGAGCNSFLESLCALLSIGKSWSKKNRFFARGSIIVNCTCSDRKNLCGAIWYHRLEILYMDHRTFWLALALVRVFISPLPLAHPPRHYHSSPLPLSKETVQPRLESQQVWGRCYSRNQQNTNIIMIFPTYFHCRRKIRSVSITDYI